MSKNINYCIVGNTDSLPEDIPSDIDIVVDPLSIGLIDSLLFKFANNNQIYLIQILQHEQTAFYFILAWMSEKGELHFLHPDICGDYYRNGRKLISAKKILQKSVVAGYETGEPKNFPVPPPDMEFIYYLIKKIDKENLNSKHFNHITREWGKDIIGATNRIKKIWPTELANSLSRAFKEKNYSNVVDALPALKNELHTKYPIKFFDFFLELKRKIKRILFPTGLFIAFLGPDGSGKSSVIDQMTIQLAPAFRNTQYIHLRPTLFTMKKKKNISVDTPHGKAPRGRISSLFKIIYFLFDYNAGYLIKILPFLIKSNMVIFDRYYYDLLVDPRRYRYSGPMWLARIIGKLMPEPDLIFILDAPANVLQERKQEVSYDETERQRISYLKLGKKIKNTIIVDTSQPLEKVILTVNQTTIQFLAKRTKKRLGF